MQYGASQIVWDQSWDSPIQAHHPAEFKITQEKSGDFISTWQVQQYHKEIRSISSQYEFKIQKCKEIITDFRVSDSWYSTTVVLQLLAIKHKDLMGYKHQSAFFVYS